jgi:AcrR family transcriptional regulator
MATNETGGLRERKKAATREALSAAALRLALAYGPENVRVDEIAEAAGVSPRTYNNYFASREQAIVAALTAERALRVVTAVRARPATEPLADAVVEAVVEQYTTEPDDAALLMITRTPRLCEEFVDSVSAFGQPLASAIADRMGDHRTLAPTVLAAAVAAAARVAVRQWVRPAGPSGDFLVVQGGRPLAELLRDALSHVAPALRAADARQGG